MKKLIASMFIIVFALLPSIITEKSDTPPPKPKAPTNGNKPVTKGDQLKSLI